MGEINSSQNIILHFLRFTSIELAAITILIIENRLIMKMTLTKFVFDVMDPRGGSFKVTQIPLPFSHFW